MYSQLHIGQQSIRLSFLTAFNYASRFWTLEHFSSSTAGLVDLGLPSCAGTVTSLRVLLQGFLTVGVLGWMWRNTASLNINYTPVLSKMQSCTSPKLKNHLFSIFVSPRRELSPPGPPRLYIKFPSYVFLYFSIFSEDAAIDATHRRYDSVALT